MATVIDELITRLTLDPAEFEEGEARLVQTLRRMEAAAERGGRAVTTTVGRGALDFFRAVENPIGALRRHFEGMVVQTTQTREGLRKVGEAGEETGERVARGMSAATVGVRALGIAGLAAFAAYEVLSKSLRAVGDVAGRVLTTGIGAAASGMGINEFGAISQALFARGNVPQAETQNWLAQYQEMQGQATRGISPGIGFITDLNTKLAQTQTMIGPTGIDPFRDTPEQMATKLSRALAAAPEAQAYSAGSALGLSRQMVYGLRTTGAGLPGDIASQRSRAPGGADEIAAQRLIEAENKLSTAWEKLERDIMLSGLADALTRFATWLDQLIAPDPSDARNLWQRAAPSWLGGRPGPGSAALALPGSATGAPGIIAAAGAAGANESATAVLLSAAMGEGGLGTDSWRQNAGGAPVYGRWQFNQSGELPRYLREGNAPGDDAAQTRYVLKRLNEIMPGFSTSTDVDAQVAAITKFESSGQGPEYYARGLSSARRLIAGTQEQRQTIRPQPQQPAAPSGRYHVPDPLDWILGPVEPSATAPLPPAQPRISAIQRSNAASGTSTTTHNYGDNNIDITVHAPTREGEDIANTVRDKVAQYVPMVTPANTGLA
jgi:hypothetical protein